MLGIAFVRLPKPLKTSSFRLTLIYAGVFAGSVLILFGIVVLSATKFMARQIDATVANELAEVQADATRDNLRAVVDGLTARSPGIFYLLQSAEGEVLAGNMDAVRPETGARRLAWMRQRASKHAAGGIRGRGVLLTDGSYLFVGLSDFELGEMQEVVAQAFLWGLAVMLLLALSGGVVTSVSLLRKVEAISATSRDIMAGDLGRRIPLRGVDDEFDHLASSLNAMLERIQGLMAELQHVTNDIAHDLRTPLTRLRQRLELAYQRGPGADNLHEAVGGAIEQTDTILETFAALLRIAQIETGTRRTGFQLVDLTAILTDLAETYQVVAEEMGQVVVTSLPPGLCVYGDRQLLMQLYANLIENAIGHSPIGSTVCIEASTSPLGIRTSVSDTGEGIPSEYREKVLQRFFRMEASRTMPGTGLGLSLANAIVSLHEAHLSLQDNAPGLRCVVDFIQTPATTGQRPEIVGHKQLSLADTTRQT